MYKNLKNLHEKISHEQILREKIVREKIVHGKFLHGKFLHEKILHDELSVVPNNSVHLGTTKRRTKYLFKSNIMK